MLRIMFMDSGKYSLVYSVVVEYGSLAECWKLGTRKKTEKELREI
jgi:hypothetical protein